MNSTLNYICWRQFLEVTCPSSGKVWRFAAGTEAGFAVYLINRKKQVGIPPAFHIEAVKEGEEPVNFGPKAALVNYGEGWKLKTATEEGEISCQLPSLILLMNFKL